MMTAAQVRKMQKIPSFHADSMVVNLPRRIIERIENNIRYALDDNMTMAIISVIQPKGQDIGNQVLDYLKCIGYNARVIERYDFPSGNSDIIIKFDWIEKE